MSTLWALVDQAVADALAAHPDYLTPRGQEAARKMIVRKVTGALRDNITAPKKTEDETEAQSEAAPRSTTMNAWSREWWAALLRRIERKQPTDFMMRCAASGGQWAAETDPVLPEAIEVMTAYPSDGAVVAAWRPWFKAHRIELPEWRKQVWVFLPSTDPPKESSAA